MTSSAPWPHSIVILTGGTSSRMGKPKHALMRPDGTSLVDVAVNCAREAASEVIIAGPDDIQPELKHVDDDGSGPLSGIVATLEGGEDERYLFMPCDMPHLTPGLLIQLGHGLGDHDAAVYRDPQSGKQAMLPLAVQARTLEAARSTMAGRKRSIYAFLANIDSIDLRMTDDEQFQLLNINHPADWERYLGTLGN